MKRGWIERSALAAGVVGALMAGAAHAQTAAPDAPTAPASDAAAPASDAAAPAPMKAKPKPKPRKPKIAKLPSIEVVVTNHRTVGLVALTAALSGGAQPVKIAGPLGEGQKVVTHVAHDKACLFDLRGVFADGAETETQSYDLCKDKTIDLVD
jgi:hypothetical protein